MNCATRDNQAYRAWVGRGKLGSAGLLPRASIRNIPAHG